MNDENPYEVSKRPTSEKESALKSVLKILATMAMGFIGLVGLLMSLCGVIAAIPSPGAGSFFAVVGGVLLFVAYKVIRWVNRPAPYVDEVAKPNAAASESELP